MNGGAGEYAMGNMVNSKGLFYASNSGFSVQPDSKYYNSYTYSDSSYTTHGRGKLGDATKETLKIYGNASGGWYGDYTYFPYTSLSWFTRGGYNYGSGAGIFNFYWYSGNASSVFSTRAVLCK